MVHFVVSSSSTQFVPSGVWLQAGRPFLSLSVIKIILFWGLLTYYHVYVLSYYNIYMFLSKMFSVFHGLYILNGPRLGHLGVHHMSRDNGNVILVTIFRGSVFSNRCKKLCELFMKSAHLATSLFYLRSTFRVEYSGLNQHMMREWKIRHQD